MIINVGTVNTTKVGIVQNLDGFYDWFRIDRLNPVKVSSEVSDQPMTLEETLQGAKNRAKNAYNHSECTLGIGTEHGLMPLIGGLTWYIACECAAIYDGSNFYIGTGGWFEYPRIVIERVLSHWEDLSQAYRSVWLTDQIKIGENEWAIGHLTLGKIDRKEYAGRILIYALTSLHNKELYL